MNVRQEVVKVCDGLWCACAVECVWFCVNLCNISSVENKSKCPCHYSWIWNLMQLFEIGRLKFTSCTNVSMIHPNWVIRSNFQLQVRLTIICIQIFTKTCGYPCVKMLHYHSPTDTTRVSEETPVAWRFEF